MSPPSVLFANHTGELAGAERSLLDLLEALDDQVTPAVACPQGELISELRARGVHAIEIPGTEVSFRPHPVHTPRGLAQMIRVGLRLRRLADEMNASLIHANTERAGLSAIAAGFSGPPIVVHVRTRFPRNRLGAITARALGGRAAAIIANSRYTADQFGAASNGAVHVVHNPIDAARFRPGGMDRRVARAKLGLEAGDTVLAVVGYIAPVKGQDDAIRILAGVKREHPRARLVLAGGPRFATASARMDNLAFERELKDLASRLGVARDALFVGERDVREVLAATDLLLVPSRQEGFGRVALEGMAIGAPLIATSIGGPAEIVRDGVDGILLPPGEPERWIRAASGLLSDPVRCRAMGSQARQRAVREFSPEVHSAGIRAVYESVLELRGAEASDRT